MPPKGPARIGQAHDAAGSVKQLERIRQVPDYRYSVKKYEFADKILEYASWHKPKGAKIDEELDIDARIEHLLLNPAIIPVLEEKLAVMP